ncbi:MAG: response regulator transcription factor [Anaerolineae bacterium]|nr:response regulator transcription factor [Anaerolineae bacterium]
MTDKVSILVVDDEETIREVLRRYLEKEGFQVQEAADGYEALDLIKEDAPSLIILDLMLPGIDGLTMTQHLRQDRQIPIIMLTAKGEESDRIRGLDLGADDYITKPFSPQEVVSRIRAVLRRVNGESPSETGQPIILERIHIDPAARTVRVDGNEITLTVKEFDLLWCLASNPHKAYSRGQLLEKAWEDALYTDPTTVTVHIRRLREKIELNPSEPFHIQTVWGVGYKFVDKKQS